EFHANGAAVVAARFLGIFAGEAFEIGAFQRGEVAERVERGFIKAPAAEKIEDAFAFGMRVGIGRGGFLRVLRGLIGSERRTVGHSVYLQTFYFATRRGHDSDTWTGVGTERNTGHKKRVGSHADA